MSDRKPAFFATDHLPGWRAALLRGWVWVRLCFRNSPGYATAAVAGSLGIVLAVTLLLRGGATNLLTENPPEPETDAEDTLVELGDSDAPAIAGGRDFRVGFASDNDGAGVGGGIGSMRRSKPATVTIDPDDDPFAEEVATSAAQSRPYRGRSTLVDAESPLRAIELDDNSESADVSTRVLPRALEPVEESELREESEPGEEFSDTADDAPLIANLRTNAPQEVDDADENAGKPIAETPAQKPRARVFIPEDEVAVDDTEDAAQIGRSELAIDSPTVADDAREPSHSDDESLIGESRPRPSWQNSTTRPARAKPTPPLPLAEQSDEVQTTIHAAPAESVGRAEIEPAAASAPQVGSPLRLQVNAPSQITAGQTLELEFLVVNLGDAPLRDVVLSVYLPPGLTHALGPDLERPIAHIAVRELQRVRLTVKATADGPFKLKADLATGGHAGGKLSATIGAGRVATSASRLPADCQSGPLR